MTIKPIETVFDGFKFRSRLEARWAVFFKTLDIPYQYEVEGYDLDGTWYLPDFWLPEHQYWIEIKGQEPSHDEYGKAEMLSALSGYDVHVFWGDIPYQVHDDDHSFSAMGGNTVHDKGQGWFECQSCNTFRILPGTEHGIHHGCDVSEPESTFIVYTSRLRSAYTAARQARFEHQDRHR